MTPPSWVRLKDAFAAALELPAPEREPHLRRALGDHPEMLAEALTMLAAHERGQGEHLFQPRWLPELPDFEIQRELGSGATGVVYLARQRSLDRLVALKVMRGHLGCTEAQLADFRREPAKVARIEHPGIVRVHSVSGSTEIPYFVMEYVPGKSLKQLLSECERGPNGEIRCVHPLGPASASWEARVGHVVAAAADALQHAHESKLIHRDVKPGNVLIDGRGEPHLVDFGLAKDVDAQTLSSKVLGTPYYMSPEQARVRRVKVDARTDVYSLGVVLYEMLTLERPFERETYTQVFDAIRDYDPPRPRRRNRRVNADLEAICLQAMHKDPDHRYATAGAFAADLRRFLAHQPSQAKPPTAGERAWRVVKRRKGPMAAVVLVAAAVSLGWRISEVRAQQSHTLALLSALPTPDAMSCPEEASDERADEAISIVEGARRTVKLLRRRALDGAEEQEVARVEAAVEDFCAQLVERSRSRVRRHLEARRNDPSSYRPAELLLERARLLRIAALLPDADRREEVDIVLDSLAPRIRFRSEPTGARVTGMRLDPFSDAPLEGVEPVYLGVSGPDPLTVEPGVWLFVLETADGYRAEYRDRVDDLDEIETPRLRLQPVGAAAQGMLFVPEGTWRLTREDGTAVPAEPPRARLLTGPIRVPGFWIDRREVTNGQYRQFCRETGYPPPPPWPEGAVEGYGWDDSWDELPATGMGLFGAMEYAAWAGKRLPTRFEWERAARGEFNWSWPTGASSPPPRVHELAAVLDLDLPSLPFSTNPAIRWQQYVERVAPVSSHPGDRSPFGLEDVLGSASEWTVTEVRSEVRPGVWEPTLSQRWSAGGHWRRGAVPLWVLTSVDVTSEDLAIGFRCVRSAAR